MKTYDEVVAGVLEGTAAHKRKVKRMQKIASLTTMCAVCIIGLSVYMNLEPRQSLPADSGSDILTQTQPYLEQQPSEYIDSSVQIGTTLSQEQHPTDVIPTEQDPFLPAEPSVLPPHVHPVTEPEGIQNVTDPVSTEPPHTDTSETKHVQEETQEVHTASPPTSTEPPATDPVETQPPVEETDPDEPDYPSAGTDEGEPTSPSTEGMAPPPTDTDDSGDYPTMDTMPTETTETTTTAPIYQTTTVTVTVTIPNTEKTTEHRPDHPVSLKLDLPYCKLFQEE